MSRWHYRTGKALLYLFMLVAIYLLFAGDFVGAVLVSGPFAFVLWKLRNG